MGMPARIGVTALTVAALWMPTTRAQTPGGGPGADGIPAQLQTDAQRQATKSRRELQQRVTQAPSGPRQGGEPGAHPAIPSARGVEGSTVATELATAATIDALDAAASAVTDAILESAGETYPARGDDNRGNAGPGQGWPVEGQSPQDP